MAYLQSKSSSGNCWEADVSSVFPSSAILEICAASPPGAVASGKTGSVGFDGCLLGVLACNSPTTPRAPRSNKERRLGTRQRVGRESAEICVWDYHISWRWSSLILISHLDIHHISEPILLEQYVAISDYTKREESDINLKAGNVVDVIEKNEHGESGQFINPKGTRIRTEKRIFGSRNPFSWRCHPKFG